MHRQTYMKDRQDILSEEKGNLGPFLAPSSHYEAKKRLDVLHWLSVLDFKAKDNDIRSKRVKNCGEWFVNCAEFKTWLSDPTSKLIHCRGPGMSPQVLS